MPAEETLQLEARVDWQEHAGLKIQCSAREKGTHSEAAEKK